MYDYYSHIAMWMMVRGLFCISSYLRIRQPERMTKSEMLGKTNPGLGKIKSYKTLANNVEKAKRNPKFLPPLLVKDFKVSENTSESW
jgi:phage terminase large subunit-like protein